MLRLAIAFVLALSSCASEVTKQDLIIGTWTTSPVNNITDLTRTSYYAYGKDSNVYEFFGDYAHSGIYYIENSKLITIYPTMDTAFCSILAINDSIFRLKSESNNIEYTLYRFAY